MKNAKKANDKQNDKNSSEAKILTTNKKPLVKMSKTMQGYFKKHINQQKIELIGKSF